MAREKQGFNKYKIENDVATIYMNKMDGTIIETIIDAEDLERIKSQDFKWYPIFANNTKSYYAQATERFTDENGERKGRTHFLNKEIMQEFELFVDHKNHDTLNNRKYNLRVSENKQNTKHRKGANSNNTSGYRNVTYDKKSDKWIVQLQVNGKNKILGRFTDLDEAGEFAEEMREKYYKDFKGNN